eukprot:2496896-Alexandrium_andersonii.AAC.1
MHKCHIRGRAALSASFSRKLRRHCLNRNDATFRSNQTVLNNKPFIERSCVDTFTWENGGRLQNLRQQHGKEALALGRAALGAVAR